MSNPVIEEIAEERERQKAIGWTPEHDDTHARGELARAAACYALGTRPPLGPIRDTAYGPRNFGGTYWPWDGQWWKPTTPRRNLVKAAALIVAEIERLDRSEVSHEH